jgi:hypothetical protein
MTEGASLDDHSGGGWVNDGAVTDNEGSCLKKVRKEGLKHH